MPLVWCKTVAKAAICHFSVCALSFLLTPCRNAKIEVSDSFNGLIPFLLHHHMKAFQDVLRILLVDCLWDASRVSVITGSYPNHRKHLFSSSRWSSASRWGRDAKWNPVVACLRTLVISRGVLMKSVRTKANMARMVSLV